MPSSSRRASTPGVDLSEFAAAAPTGRAHQCWYSSKLNDEQRAKVTAARKDGYSYGTIRKVLVSWGIHVGDGSMSSHFNKTCHCDA